MHAESTYVPYAPSSTREISVYRFYESKRCKMLGVNIYGWEEDKRHVGAFGGRFEVLY